MREGDARRGWGRSEERRVNNRDLFFSLCKMAYESLAMISSALSRLECGQLGVMRSVSINVVHLLLCIYKHCTCF